MQAHESIVIIHEKVEKNSKWYFWYILYIWVLWMRTFFRPVRVRRGKFPRGFSAEMILVVSIRRTVVIGRFVIGRLVVRLLVLYAKAQVLLTAKIINILLQNINATMSVYKWKSVSFLHGLTTVLKWWRPFTNRNSQSERVEEFFFRSNDTYETDRSTSYNDDRSW